MKILLRFVVVFQSVSLMTFLVASPAGAVPIGLDDFSGAETVITFGPPRFISARSAVTVDDVRISVLDNAGYILTSDSHGSYFSNIPGDFKGFSILGANAQKVCYFQEFFLVAELVVWGFPLRDGQKRQGHVSSMI